MVSAQIAAVERAERVAALALEIAVRTSSSAMPMEASATGLTRTRIAGCSAPLTVTSATPSTCDDALRDHACRPHRRSALAGMVFDVSARISIGDAAGLTLRNVGRVGRSPGRSVSAALSAACTSRAAPSMSRSNRTGR